MPDYLLTISAQQKAGKVLQHELEDVQFWLQAHGVVFICRRYESTGLYKQLHFHGLVRYLGKFSHLTKWGDLDYTNNTFSINFKKVTNYRGAITYLLKPGSYEVTNITKKGGAQHRQRSERGIGGSSPSFRTHSLSSILKRTL